MVEPAPVVSDPSPPPRKRLPRLFSVLIGVIVLIAIAAAAAPWAFSNAALREEIANQIHHKTGLATLSQGHVVFVVLPRPHISIDDVSFADPSGALRIDARYLKGYVRLSALLAGRIEITSATLGQPDMRIDLDHQPIHSDSVISRAAEASPASKGVSFADEAQLGSLTIVDGRARVASKRLAEDVAIDAMNVMLDWHKLGAAAILTGEARIHGETAVIAAWVASPAALLRGQQSPLNLKIDGPSLSLSLDGGVVDMPNWQFNGAIHAATPSLRALLEDAGYRIPLPGPLSDFEAGCTAAISAKSAVLSDLNLRFDGNEYEGTLAFQTRETVPILSGTLATNRLSLQPFFSALPPAAGRDGQWNRDPFDLREFGSADLDLRISAAHMVFSRFEIEDAAFSVMRNSGRLELALAGAKAYQGTIKGRATFDLGVKGVRMQAAGAISGAADFAALSFDAFGWPEFAGSLDGTANLESRGASVNDLMHNLEGTAKIDVAQGQLGGIDLTSALHRIDKTPLTLLADIHRGRTAFDQASLSLHFVDGVARIEDGNLENHSLRLAFGGSLDFGERGLNLHAVAKPVAAAPQGKEAPDFAFDVSGSWDDLALTPDVRDLIRRSGAAAPLFSQQHDVGKPALTDPEGER
ncbi:MAG TPA: AsmA family protein [Methylocella sp.]|nr:AsmA family protein [Methylocella sp.]